MRAHLCCVRLPFMDCTRWPWHKRSHLIYFGCRWYEALAPGGRLFLSVPDFPTLCWLYLTPSNTMNGRFRILQVGRASKGALTPSVSDHKDGARGHGAKGWAITPNV